MYIKLNETGSQSFNMTPIIDMVFLLIIFFSLVSRFIEAENFDVSIPDRCSFAENKQDNQAQLTTVTVIKNHSGVEFAVGSEKISTPNRDLAAEKIAQLLDGQLKNLSPADRVVVLRIDKDVPYADAQYALAGIAKSAASDIQLAVLKEKK
jgi:biopolymer transport protein ExbD